MKLASLLFVPLLLAAPMAFADDSPSATTPNSAEPSASADKSSDNAPAATEQATPAPVTKPVPTPAITPNIVLTPAASANSPEAKAMAELNRIRARAKEVDPKEKAETDKSLHETAAEVDAASAKKEKVEVAGRLAAQFGGIPELYVGEHDRLKAGWGEIAIAHTLLANAKTTVTIDQLFDLRQEGLGWGQIAHGLDLNVGDFVRMARANGHAAVGAPGSGAKPDQVEAKADAGDGGAKESAGATKDAKGKGASPAAAAAKGGTGAKARK